MNYNAILPNKTLFVGDYTTAQNIHVLNDLKVTHIVSVGFHKGLFPDKFKYLAIDINDGPTENILMYLPRSVAFLEDSLANDGVTYVHCVHGQSRSCTVVIAFLMHDYWKNPMSSVLSHKTDDIERDPRTLLHYCYEYTMSCRPCMAINPGFVKQLELYRQMKMISNVQKRTMMIKSPILSSPHATFRAMKAKSDFYENGRVRVFLTMDLCDRSEVHVCKKCSLPLFGPENICLELSTEELDQLPSSDYWKSSKGGLEYYATNKKKSDIFRDFEHALQSERIFKVEPLDWMKSSMVEDHSNSLRPHGILFCQCGQKLGYWDFCCYGEYPILVLESRVEKRVHRC